MNSLILNQLNAMAGGGDYQAYGASGEYRPTLGAGESYEEGPGRVMSGMRKAYTGGFGGTSSGKGGWNWSTKDVPVYRDLPAPAAAVAPAARNDEPSTREINQPKIDEAVARANAAKEQYAASIPTYDTGKDPYTAASQYGRDMQNSLLKYQDFADAKASAQTTEISEASRQALGRFGGKVADYQLPNWRDYLNA